MFTDPDIHHYLARQRQAELIAEAENDRLAKSVRQRNRGREPVGRRTNSR